MQLIKANRGHITYIWYIYIYISYITYITKFFTFQGIQGILALWQKGTAVKIFTPSMLCFLRSWFCYSAWEKNISKWQENHKNKYYKTYIKTYELKIGILLHLPSMHGYSSVNELLSQQLAKMFHVYRKVWAIPGLMWSFSKRCSLREDWTWSRFHALALHQEPYERYPTVKRTTRAALPATSETSAANIF